MAPYLSEPPGTSKGTRKSLGAYYTPSWLAEMLVSHVITPTTRRVLDPSFGGCSFLQAALEALRAQPSGATRIFGVDIDRSASVFAKSLIQSGVPARNLIIADFLSRRTLQQIGTFDAVVGNPPYIRHHAIDDKTVDEAQRAATFVGATLPRLASTWAYFAVLATSCVAVGGHLAMILPGALLHTRYGQHVLDFVEHRFLDVRLVHVHDRLFEGTWEESIILLGRDRQDLSFGVRAKYFRPKTGQDIESALTAESADAPDRSTLTARLSLIPSEAVDTWHRVREASGAVALGDIARVRIGIVTGANNFFIRRADDPIFRLSGVSRRRIITRNGWLTDPVMSRRLVDRLERRGERTSLALIPGDEAIGPALRRELRRAELHGLAQRAHCAKRAPWHAICDLDVPDLFLGYLNAVPPILVRNDARVLCTNAIHRVTLSDPQFSSGVVASSLSSLFTFEAELYGRHYGGGILKLEPSEAKKLSVIPDLVADVGFLISMPSSHRQMLVNDNLAQRGKLAGRDFQLLTNAAAMLRAERERRGRSSISSVYRVPEDATAIRLIERD
jgi:adenine-specific DNA-methyltransferase